jgi:hypothetical protein
VPVDSTALNNLPLPFDSTTSFHLPGSHAYVSHVATLNAVITTKNRSLNLIISSFQKDQKHIPGRIFIAPILKEKTQNATIFLSSHR